MIKLVLWDYTGQSSTWCENFLRPNVAQIVRTLKPDDPDQAEFIMRGDWDYVFIFDDDNSQAVFNEILSTMRAMNVPTDKIIFATSALSWTEHPAAAHLLLEPKKSEKVFRWLNFVNHKKWHQYNVCTVGDLHYVGTSADEYTLSLMCLDQKNYAADEMQAFHALSKKFYGVDDSDGYFLDLGANIGTTGVYFLKKLASRLKLFAVEPDAENFKLLRVNLIMNDLDNRATLVNCGLGDKFDTVTLYKSLSNPAANNFLNDYVDNYPAETIQIAPLDYLLAESDISPDEVKYIWIDTEGFEAQVLLGAKNLLAQSNAPVFVECNLLAWKNSGLLERLIELLSNVGYRHFITIQEFLRTGNEKIYPIENLLVAVNYVEPPLGQIGDIFLIKNLQA